MIKRFLTNYETKKENVRWNLLFDKFLNCIYSKLVWEQICEGWNKNLTSCEQNNLKLKLFKIQVSFPCLKITSREMKEDFTDFCLKSLMSLERRKHFLKVLSTKSFRDHFRMLLECTDRNTFKI